MLKVVLQQRAFALGTQGYAIGAHDAGSGQPTVPGDKSHTEESQDEDTEQNQDDPDDIGIAFNKPFVLLDNAWRIILAFVIAFTSRTQTEYIKALPSCYAC